MTQAARAISCHYTYSKTVQRYDGGTAREVYKNNIKLQTYNGMHIMQLGTCAVLIKFKNLKNFFVVLGNGQVLLGMPDTAALNIINLNIDSIQVEIASCKTNREQEMYTVAEGRTNTDAGAINKQDTNSQNIQNNSHNSINYFFSSSNVMADKRQSSEMTQRMHDRFGNIFNGIGCFEVMFSLQLKPNSKPYQAPPRHVAYSLQKPFKEEL